MALLPAPVRPANPGHPTRHDPLIQAVHRGHGAVAPARSVTFGSEFRHAPGAPRGRAFHAGRADIRVSIEQLTARVVRHNDRAQLATQ